jgi:hypothetical protein
MRMSFRKSAANDVRQIVVAVVNGELESIDRMFARLLGLIAEALARG